MDGTVMIFNRWGEVVYESSDLLQSWDGKSKAGQLVKDGTYFYKIEVRPKLGGVEKTSGFLTVIR